MSLKIYGASASPPFRAVLKCAKVLEIDLKVQTIDFINGEHLSLKKTTDFFLADSHAINGYLIGKFGKENDPLYPKNDIKRRALIDHRLHLDSSIIAAKGLQITRPLNYHRLKPTQQSLDDLKEAFGFLEKQLDSNYIVGKIPCL
ncbi:unnamed protein product [Ceutorhynchus assimilis]|uniref:GST N-terminal domain-containing protein n=1 Tax=Ceutorhynchus assimilis TaxID=467358 RepID=A0A9N9MC42_9CUCU|nr:unnamed protein product [Ceutorhynchus assimilis]